MQKDVGKHDWQDHVVTDASLYRPTDIAWGGGNPVLAEDKLGWRAEYKMSDVVRMMVEDRIANDSEKSESFHGWN